MTTEEPSYEVAVEQNVVVPMSDGTRLVADVYRPLPRSDQPADQRFPCLFEMTPYRKEGRAAEGAGVFPERGFVLMELDARGTGGSAGEYDGVFLPQEQEDGYDAIDQFRPDRYDLIGAAICLLGVAVIMYAPR